MKIHNKRRLRDLQEEFHQIFPYLKIEFFRKPHQEGIGSDEEEKLNPELLVGMVRQNHSIGIMPTNGDLTVGAFEQALEATFGLYVQVYRKSHGKWLQTWVTDIWTLAEQNNRGKVIGEMDALLAKK
ncbi:MAG: hypothetical protein AAF573_01065 [Bacteroidota bacterium]